jgi:hypothetical protein
MGMQVNYAIQKRGDGAYYVVATNGETVRCESRDDAQFYVFQKTGKTVFQQSNPELYKNEGIGLNWFAK